MRILSCVALCIVFGGSLQAQQPPKEVLSSAIGVWHMANADEATGKSISLTPQGAADLGIALQGEEHQASIDRGGDGMVAHLHGGWLMLGEAVDGKLRNSPKLAIQGYHFTWLIRLRCLHEKLWVTRGIFSQGGGHDALSFNLFSYDFGQGREGMRLGFEIGAQDRNGLSGQVTTPVAQIGAERWHDLVVRYDGATLEMFVDGVSVDRQPANGQLRAQNKEPIAIGASTFQGQADNPFPGFVDHAALWNRTLSDAEIVAVCGGEKAVAETQSRFASFNPKNLAVNASDSLEGSRALKAKFQQDPHRPRYHFLHCEEGDAMPGDPNGAIWWKGRYHLFYIFQRHQNIEPKVVHCWGHASSVDLCHWEHHPTGLDVAPTDPDRGIFSGNALVSREGIPTIVYHGVGIGNSMAQSTDDLLLHWTKSPNNPIVPNTKPGDEGFGKYDSWDPHCWLEGDNYFAIFGGNPGTGTPATLFRGPEINGMQYVGPAVKGDKWSIKEEDISCPDFFPLGDKHVLSCISHMLGARCFIGTWKDGVFTPEQHVRMNWPGGAFFAPETLVDDQNRRILWAWCLDERPDADRVKSGWSGVMSLPRVLSLDSEHQMQIEPVPELQRLRYHPRELKNLTVTAKEASKSGNAELDLPSMRGDCMELEIELQANDSDYYGICLRSSEDRREETMVGYDPKKKTLRIDVRKSTLDPSIRYRSWCLFRPSDAQEANRTVEVQEVPLELKPGESLKLRVFLDHSMLEVFANGRQCATQRVWPTLPDSVGTRIFTQSGTLRVPSVKAWDMAATTPD